HARAIAQLLLIREHGVDPRTTPVILRYCSFVALLWLCQIMLAAMAALAVAQLTTRGHWFSHLLQHGTSTALCLALYLLLLRRALHTRLQEEEFEREAPAVGSVWLSDEDLLPRPGAQRWHAGMRVRVAPPAPPAPPAHTARVCWRCVRCADSRLPAPAPAQLPRMPDTFMRQRLGLLEPLPLYPSRTRARRRVVPLYQAQEGPPDACPAGPGVCVQPCGAVMLALPAACSAAGPGDSLGEEAEVAALRARE
ncbi:MAG: hypothetical protein ACK4UX_13200, partial [Thiobacillus sp.]